MVYLAPRQHSTLEILNNDYVILLFKGCYGHYLLFFKTGHYKLGNAKFNLILLYLLFSHSLTLKVILIWQPFILPIIIISCLLLLPGGCNGSQYALQLLFSKKIKNIADTSTTVKAREKMNAYLEWLEFYNFFVVGFSKFKANQILVNKSSTYY